MDFDGLRARARRASTRRACRCVARDTPEPSPLRARDPERASRTRSSTMRRSRSGGRRRSRRGATSEPSAPAISARSIAAAIERVRDEARPDPRDADELHDALLTAGFLDRSEIAGGPARSSAAARDNAAGGTMRCRPRGAAIGAAIVDSPPSGCPSSAPSIRTRWSPAIRRRRRPGRRSPGRATDAIVECCAAGWRSPARSPPRRLPTRSAIADSEADAALLALEAEGVVLRGRFSSAARRGCSEWCDRTLLARIHRYTLNRLRAEIEPVSPADFMRFLFSGSTSSRARELDRARRPARDRRRMLDGFELAAGAWERAVLPARLDRYEPSMLDMLCLAGEVGWGRLSAIPSAGVLARRARAGDADRAVPPRARRRVAGAADDGAEEPRLLTATCARRPRRCCVRAAHRSSAISHPDCSLDADQLRHAIGALVACGPRRRRTDSPACVRSCGRRAARPARADRRASFAGRWTAVESRPHGRAIAKPRSRRRRWRCCAATASSSAGC